MAIIGFGISAETGDPAFKYITDPRETSEALYQLVRQQLAEQRKWQILNAEQIRQLPQYRRLYSKFSSHSLNSGLRLQGLLADIEAVNLKSKQLDGLVKELKADALLNLGFRITSVPPVPTAPRQPKAPPVFEAKASFDLFVKGNAASIWHVASRPAVRQGPEPVLPAPRKGASADEKALATAIVKALLGALADGQEPPP